MSVIQDIVKPIADVFKAQKQAKSVVDNADDRILLKTVDAEFFNQYLPYRYEDDGVFINTHSVGVMYLVPTFSGLDDTTLNSLYNTIIKDLPDDWDVKVTLECHGKIGHYLDRISGSVSPKVAPIFKKVIAKQVQFYRHAIKHGFETKDGTKATLRDYCIYIEIAKPIKEIEYQAKRLEIKEDIIHFEKSLKQLYQHDDKKSERATVFKLSSDQFLQLTGNIIGYDTEELYKDKYNYNANEPIHIQCTPNNWKLYHYEDALDVVFEKQDKKIETGVVSLSLKNPKDMISVNFIRDCYANVTRNSTLVDVPFLMSIFIRRYNKDKSENRAVIKKRAFKGVAGSALSYVYKNINKAYQEWDELEDQIKKGDNQLCDVFFNFTLFESEDLLDAKVKQVIDSFHANGFDLVRDDCTQLQSFLAQLPFTITNGLYHDMTAFGRLSPRSAWNAINLMPVVTDWSMKGSGVILPSFRNQFVSFNQFDQSAGSAHNVSVAAKTGAGKSFLVLCWVFYVLSQGGRAWIFDRGDSYKHLCQGIGGQYLNKSNIRLNPFTFCNGSTQALSDITDIICVMAYPNKVVEQEQKEHIGFAVQTLWNEKGNKATIDDLLDCLNKNYESSDKEEDKKLIWNIITVLEGQYASKTRTGQPGRYAEFFQGSSNLDPNASLTVLELKGFPNDLLTSVMFILMLNVNEQIYNSDRYTPKACIFDEAWKLLSSDVPGAADFIEEGSRTVRKHCGSYITIVQSLIEDYTNGSMQARICYEQSSYKFTLLQNVSEGMREKLEKELGVQQADMVSRFGEAKTQGFSTLMLQTDNSVSYHRLFVDPFSRVLFSTDAAVFQAVEDYIAAGDDIYDAVRKVALVTFPDEIKRIYGEDF